MAFLGLRPGLFGLSLVGFQEVGEGDDSAGKGPAADAEGAAVFG